MKWRFYDSDKCVLRRFDIAIFSLATKSLCSEIN